MVDKTKNTKILFPERKNNRLKNYNYSANGAYFITVCVKDRKNLLCNIVGDDAHIVPSKYGLVVKKYIENIEQIEKYVIMPNHIHMIININGAMWASPPTKSISSIIRSLKTLVTKEIGESIFQRSFYDHIIRNEQDYLEIWNYIDTNPLKWKEDKLYK